MRIIIKNIEKFIDYEHMKNKYCEKIFYIYYFGIVLNFDSFRYGYNLNKYIISRLGNISCCGYKKYYFICG